MFTLALMLGFCAAAGGQATASAMLKAVSDDSAGPLPDAPLPQTEQISDEASKPEDSGHVTVRDTPLNILRDQGAIWSSPVRLHVRDLKWLAPLALATGAAIGTDHRAMTQVVSQNSSFNQANTTASNVLIGGFIAAPVALYGFAHFGQSAHAREASILSAEAILDGLVVEQGVKLVFWRERPDTNNARGRFFKSDASIDSSFPSSHSVVAWAAAAELAGEYRSPWARLFIYSAATSVSLTRVLGQQHFPSDVLIGSAAGWLVGHYVYRKHHKIWMH
ncbi:MAG TPA: phosphatase PAP2 family protein [Terracidiphilus sp.]|nr:phosphatase PAP2 family protein [Terracidiphilus sp.]